MQSQRHIHCRILEWTYSQTLSGDRSLNLWAYEKESSFFGGQKISIGIFSDFSAELVDTIGEMHLVRDLNDFGIEDCVEGAIAADQRCISNFIEVLLRLPKGQSSCAQITLVTPAMVNTEQMPISDFLIHIFCNLQDSPQAQRLA